MYYVYIIINNIIHFKADDMFLINNVKAKLKVCQPLTGQNVPLKKNFTRITMLCF